MSKLNNSSEISPWESKKHISLFKGYIYQNKFEFLFSERKLSENQFILEKIQQTKYPSILDYGCSTGFLKRLLNLTATKNSYHYKGVDISKTSINISKKLYGETNFQCISPNSDFLEKNKFDIVYSRDVIVHQKEPYKLLELLLKASKKALILRTPTRDKGKTVLDVNNSFQLLYEPEIIPFIVFNIDELLKFISKDERVVSIKINKIYKVWGGERKRFLEKDLYFKETGGSRTTLLIEFNDKPRGKDKKIKVVTNIEELNNSKIHKIKSKIYSLSSKVTRIINI